MSICSRVLLRMVACICSPQLQMPHARLATLHPTSALPSLRAWADHRLALRWFAPSSLLLTRREISMTSRTCAQAPSVGDDVAIEPLIEPGPQVADLPTQIRVDGGIEIVVGPMFAGKTSELIRRVEMYEALGLCVAVVKSSKDTRYSEHHLATHDGVKKPCYAVPTLATFRAIVASNYSDIHVIAIDEAQFFPDLANFCQEAADHDGKKLILAGLDGDFKRQRFGQILDLVPLADSVTKLTAICKYCQLEQAGIIGSNGNGNGTGTDNGRFSKDATSSSLPSALFSLRITEDQGQEVVGGAEKYVAVCRRHYVQLSAKENGR